MSCPPGKIINPLTGRCIKENGTTAKKIFNTDKIKKDNSEKVNQIEEQIEKNDIFILNPKTGRLVSLNGKLGKSIKQELESQNQQIITVKAEEKRQKRLKYNGCDYGFVWSTSKGEKCFDKKTDEGKEIEKCHREKIRLVLDEFKEGKLISNKQAVKEYKKALAIALSEAKKYC